MLALRSSRTGRRTGSRPWARASWSSLIALSSARSARSMPRASSRANFWSLRSASWTISARMASLRSRRPGAPQQRLERAVLAVMAEVHARHVERDRVARDLVGRREDELGLRVHEALDEPRRGDAVHVRPRAGDPAAALERGEVEGRRRPAGSDAPGGGALLDRLARPLDLATSGRLEEVDLADAGHLAREPRQLLGQPRAAALEQLAVAIRRAPRSPGCGPPGRGAPRRAAACSRCARPGAGWPRRRRAGSPARATGTARSDRASRAGGRPRS